MLTKQHRKRLTLQSAALIMEGWIERFPAVLPQPGIPRQVASAVCRHVSCFKCVSKNQYRASLHSKACVLLVFQNLYVHKHSHLCTLPLACMCPCLLDKVLHKAQCQLGMLVCAEWSTFEFHRRLSQTRLGPWTIKFTKEHSELISKYILIHADLFSSWGLFITHCRFNIGLLSVITKDSMVGHNYIMQMTFAVLFELIPSDVSFFYHTPHTSVSPQWLCKLLLSWSPSSWCCLSWLSCRHGPLWGCGGCNACLWHRLCWQLVGTGVHWFYHQMATHIWLPPNAQAWKTCSLHIALEIDWLFFDTAHCDCL